MVKLKKDARESVDEREIKEMGNWLQRMQQHIESLEKRLDAVERRLSNEPFKQPELEIHSRSMKKALTSKLEEDIKLLYEEIEKLKKTKKEIPTISLRKNSYGKDINNLERRIEKLEKRKATVRVGKIELPIEITGIVGGFIAFLIAILLFEGYRRFVTSPLFVAFIGIILLLATGIRTYIINASKNEK